MNHLVQELAHRMQSVSRCFHSTKWPPIGLQTLVMPADAMVLFGSGTTKILAHKYLCSSLLHLTVKQLTLTKLWHDFGTIHPLSFSFSGALKNGLKTGRNAPTMSPLEKTAVTLIHLIPPFGYPTVSS